MIEIPLSLGKIALIDDADAELVLQHRWWLRPQRRNTDTDYFYAFTQVRRRHLFMHRLIMGEPPSGLVIDHANRNGLDNRRSNLRFCTHAQNMTNRRGHPSARSGFRGVEWKTDHTRGKAFRGYIRSNGKMLRGPYFADPVEAARDHDRLALLHHGEFAVLNFPVVSL